MQQATLASVLADLGVSAAEAGAAQVTYQQLVQSRASARVAALKTYRRKDIPRILQL